MTRGTAGCLEGAADVLALGTASVARRIADTMRADRLAITLASNQFGEDE
jgi:hypothetical protein